MEGLLAGVVEGCVGTGLFELLAAPVPRQGLVVVGGDAGEVVGGLSSFGLVSPPNGFAGTAAGVNLTLGTGDGMARIPPKAAVNTAQSFCPNELRTNWALKVNKKRLAER